MELKANGTNQGNEADHRSNHSGHSRTAVISGSVEAGDDVRVIEDLGFSSLDIAQLVAQMEMGTGVDPFSQGETISSITTVGSICDIYQKYMDSAQS